MTLSLHVRHDVTPERAYSVLQALANQETFDHITEYKRQLTRLRQLGLIEEETVSALGACILSFCQTKPDLWGDLIHFLHYTLWDIDPAQSYGFSWTYQKFTDAAWDLNNFDVTPEFKDAIASTLINAADVDPAIDLTAFKKGTVSLSRESMDGAIVWLKSLVPPTVENDRFSRRGFCPTELLILAAGHVAQQTGADLGVDMLLTPERRDAICRVCLLEPAALERTLDWMLPAYPEIVQPGTSAGTYGRFLRFLKWPAMADVGAR
jgi:hypothetical protein